MAKIPSELVSVASGGTESRYGIKGPATINIIPGSGGSMTCQVRVAEGGTLIDADADNASFSAATVFTMNSSVWEIRFTATTAAGTAEIAECP